LADNINSSSWNRPAFYDDDDEYSIQYKEYLKDSSNAISPVLPTEDLKNSLNDIRFIEQLLYDDTLSEDGYFKDIDYVEASPPDSELVNLEEVKDVILRGKLLNIHLLIDKIESLNNNPTPDYMLKSPSSSFLFYTNNSSPEFKIFSYHTEETSSGSTTTHADNSLLEYDSFLFEIETDQEMIPFPLPKFESFHFDLYDDPSSPRPPKKPPDGGILTTKVVDDISDNSTRELYVHVLNFLPFLPTLYLSHRGFKVF
nr:hypothetical protein [Tanacetum cinerariifolium]